ncbi:CUB domain-containing protein 1-like [Toxotes jaculatrix]|uniref:CUB domain-containing protein 1-like n=1 Tax=Toxotes jaculatrix TaxID=941984 RepID=UPI001B3ACE64|nr:CUB domain-containing protein 1-like [Toxotes jaculatrix]
MTCARISPQDRSHGATLLDSMSLSAVRVCLQILFLMCIVSAVSGVQKLMITPDRGTTFNISSTQVKGCKVCTGAGSSRRCDASLLLKGTTSVSVEFECSRPQDVFRVEISRNIECNTSCSGHIVLDESSSLPLLEFNRKFTWNLNATAPKAFKIDFTKTGLREINPSEKCPDRHIYTLQAFQTTGNVTVGKYCRTGSISSAQILDLGSFSVEVPAGQKLQNDQFEVSVGEEIKSLAKITLSLPKGMSSSELFSPNFPDSFPDDDVMEWYFQVPSKHKTSIKFFNLTQPTCMKKEAAVEYHSKGRAASVLGLMEPQPTHNQGNFTLMLRNCEMDRRRAGSRGLSLNIQVSASSTSLPVSCKVDLSEVEELSLYIQKLRPASDCEMKINSVTKEKIIVTSDSDLSFQGCLPEDVQVTAMRVIECSQLKDCPKTPVRLLLPVLPSCLPAPLSSVTWILRPPQHGTVELTSPSGPLKQSLPGQQCNDSIIIKVAEDNGNTIGHFCPQGAIQKIQIHTNMSVTVSSMGSKSLRTSYKNILDACFKEEISERYIFTVSSKKDTAVLVATPGWPEGMKPYSTVSWFVSVPPKMEAHVMFANLSQPKCNNHHTNIKVQRVGRPEEDYSRREDEEAQSEITVSETFYVNMSNCKPERGHFSVITKITLQESKSLLLTIILSVVAALLVIFIIVLVVVCVVIKKKKKKLNHQVSIYNPNGTMFLPGHNNFPKTREDNESHVYTSIDDTLVYTHLLSKGMEIAVYGDTDTQRPLTGHTDSHKPRASDSTGADSMEVGVYHSFRYSSQQAPPLPDRPLSKPLVDNATEDSSDEEHSSNLGPRLEPEGGN